MKDASRYFKERQVFHLLALLTAGRAWGGILEEYGIFDLAIHFDQVASQTLAVHFCKVAFAQLGQVDLEYG